MPNHRNNPRIARKNSWHDDAAYLFTRTAPSKTFSFLWGLRQAAKMNVLDEGTELLVVDYDSVNDRELFHCDFSCSTRRAEPSYASDGTRQFLYYPYAS
jgi:hypothetical protein